MTLTLDGEPIVAERGEPVAASLVAAGKLVLARSPKFHRPRGPACLRAACDGCLARVDGRPNVMTCQVPATDGMVVVSQNRLGPREVDFLRMTDWFFPDGMNHHELFAGVPGVQSVMQVFARRVAGLGKLPTEVDPPRRASRRQQDVVVVGAGPSGMALAVRLVAEGRTVEVLDDQLAIGGGLTALGKAAARGFAPLRSAFAQSLATTGRLTVRTRTVAGALYGRDLLAVGPAGAEIVEARTLVLACGAHDAALAFEGNDVPGIMSARAGGWLLGRGVLVGRKMVAVVTSGPGLFAASLAEMASGMRGVDLRIVHGQPVAVRGTSRVKSISVRDGTGQENTYAADAVFLDAVPSPAYELAEQAGARLRHETHGYTVVTDAGRVSDGVYAVGELTGTPFEVGAIEADAERTAKTIARASSS